MSLHNLDSQSIVKTLTEQDFFSRQDQGLFFKDLKSVIDWMETQAMMKSLEWMKPSIQWIKEHQLTKDIRPAICHMDFHPFNILVDHGQISAELDWSGFRVFEAETS